MDSSVTTFFLGENGQPGFGKIIWNCLCSFKIPGINISAMSLMLGILLLTLALKVLLSLFSTLDVSGSFTAGTGLSRGFYMRDMRQQAHSRRAESANKRVSNKMSSMRSRANLGGD